MACIGVAIGTGLAASLASGQARAETPFSKPFAFVAQANLVGIGAGLRISLGHVGLLATGGVDITYFFYQRASDSLWGTPRGFIGLEPSAAFRLVWPFSVHEKRATGIFVGYEWRYYDGHGVATGVYHRWRGRHPSVAYFVHGGVSVFPGYADGVRDRVDGSVRVLMLNTLLHLGGDIGFEWGP